MAAPRKLLFVDVCADPGSDRVLAEMGKLGAHCELLGPRSSFAAKSRFNRALHPLDEWGGAARRCWGLGRRLEAAVAKGRPDMIIPLDELAARALRDPRLLESASLDLRERLVDSLGAPEHFNIVSSRQRLAALAAQLGIRAPATFVTPDLAAARLAAEALGYPVVLKREHTAGGAGVSICRDPKELARAFRRGWLHARAKQNLGWIPGFRSADASPLIVQKFIAGDLAFRISACIRGVEREGADFIAERRDPTDTGASAYVRGVANPEMAAAARALIEALGYSGLVSLDFIVDANHKAHLLELNPRPIASTHLGRLFGHDVLSAVLDREASPPPSAPPRTIALFPKALDRDGDLSSDIYHDAPMDDPEVLAAYACWLARRHPERRVYELGKQRASAGMVRELRPRFKRARS